MNMASGIANQQRTVGRRAGEEILDAGRISGRERCAANEFDPAASATERAATKSITVQLSAKLEGVLASDVRDMIDELHACVRPLNLGPVKASQFLGEDIKGKNVDPW